MLESVLPILIDHKKGRIGADFTTVGPIVQRDPDAAVAINRGKEFIFFRVDIRNVVGQIGGYALILGSDRIGRRTVEGGDGLIGVGQMCFLTSTVDGLT